MSQTHRQDKFRIEGMDCGSCAKKVDTAVRRLKQISDVSVSVTSGTMLVDHQGIDLKLIENQVKKLGYSATLIPQALKSGSQETQSGEANDNDAAAASCCSGGRHNHDHESQTTSSNHGHDHGYEDDALSWWQQPKAKLTLMSGAALVAAYLISLLLPQYELYIFTIAMLVGLVPIARRALAGIQLGTPFSIETLMTVAAIGALFIGAVEEAAAVVFLFLVGELLEGVATRRARSSIRGLVDLVPKTAFIEQGDQIIELAASALQVGMIIMVRPGDRIAADGVIISGTSAINEAPVTGESTPKNKSAGDKVYAGTINSDAVLRIEVTASAQDNTIARIIKLVEEAQESKAPTERFIDRFSRWYTPAVMGLAILIAVLPPLLLGASWDEWIYKGLAILLIGCPCALVISTPAAIAAGLSSGARRGLLMKGGAVLENAGHINAIAFDKTGTLTKGAPVVTDIIAFSGDENEVLQIAAAVERGSSHPLALAILQAAEARSLPIVNATDGAALGGKGVSGTVNGRFVLLASPKAIIAQIDVPNHIVTQITALNDQGKTVSLLMVDGSLSGAIAMRDEPRDDAKAALTALQNRGIRTLMLTGDNQRTAQAIGNNLGLEVHAELMPQDKRRIINELKAQNLVVAKVGDGINDAPALAAADIGIAMGDGTDVALETADAAIMHGRVSDIGNMITLSQATMANIHQNITISIGLKVVFLFTTILGITGLWPAILADTGATVLVTANAMRLLGWRPRP